MKNNWPVKKLGEVAEVTSSKRILKRDYVADGIPFYRTKEIAELSQNKNISLDLYISQEQFKDIGDKFGIPNEGEILISAVGTIGISWIIPDSKKFYFKDGNLLWIKNFKDINSQYLKLYLDYSFHSVSKLAAGGAYKALTIINLKKFPILIPPQSEQKKIVERLDAVRKAQELCDQQIQKTEELFDSLIFKELEVLEIETQTLDKVCSFQYGYTQSASDVGKYRFIRITDIDDYGEIRNDDEKFISDNLTLLKPYILSKDDLLVARTGATYGKVLLFNLDQPSIFASFLIRIIPDKTKILPKFIWLFSRSKTYWEQAGRLVSGTGQPQFNANKIKEIKIKIPNLEEQQRIVEKLEAVQNYKKLLIKQKELLKELFDSVLDKSMKGELDN